MDSPKVQGKESPLSLKVLSSGKNKTPESVAVIILKFERCRFYHTVMCPNVVDKLTSVDPDQTYLKFGIITVVLSK